MHRLLIAAGMSLLAGAALAQTEVVPRSEAQRLACLVQPAQPPRYPQRDKLDRSYGAIRVMLKFTRPDAPPAVELLVSQAREDMLKEVLDYVGGYRLPCLQAAEGMVTAVQDFSFSNHDRDPTPMPADTEGRSPLCIVMPRKDLDYNMGPVFGRLKAEHLVAEITFEGDGAQPPRVKFIHSDASTRYEAAVRDWVAGYRMPCRKTEDPPRTVEQTFSMYPAAKPRYGLTRERFSLVEFLKMTREPAALRGHFDLNTMACPFRVDYVIGGGSYPNQAIIPGPANPNQQGFLAWLRGLQLAFKSEDMANDLFGTRLQIDVPCGTVSLGAP